MNGTRLVSGSATSRLTNLVMAPTPSIKPSSMLISSRSAPCSTCTYNEEVCTAVTAHCCGDVSTAQSIADSPRPHSCYIEHEHHMNISRAYRQSCTFPDLFLVEVKRSRKLWRKLSVAFELETKRPRSESIELARPSKTFIDFGADLLCCNSSCLIILAIDNCFLVHGRPSHIAALPDAEEGLPHVIPEGLVGQGLQAAEAHEAVDPMTLPWLVLGRHIPA